MSNKKIVFLCTLIFSRIAGADIVIETTPAEKIQALKDFAYQVSQEMQHQPSAFFLGMGLGTLVHASSLSSRSNTTVGKALNEKKVVTSQLLINSLAVDISSTTGAVNNTSSAQVLLQNQNDYIRLLQEKFNRVLESEISTQNNVTWQQIMPHVAAIGGMYKLYQFEKESPVKVESQADQNVKYAAVAANTALGFGVSYMVLMGINSFIKP